MELTRLQKAYALIGLVEMMKKADVKPDLALSESMTVLTIMTKEVETLSTKGDLGEETIKVYQDAVRKIYDSLAGDS